MEKSAAAHLLGMPESEIVDVADSSAGTVIRTFDNALVIAVDEGGADPVVKLLVHPGPGYGGSSPIYSTPLGAPGTWAEVHEREQEVLDSLGVELKSAPPRPGSPEALGVTPPPADPGLRAQPGEADMQAEALIDDPGPGREVSAENPDTGAHNVKDAADLADAGTVVPIDGSAADVLAWAGDDPVRVRQALDAERAKDNPRSRLVNQLAAKAGDPVRSTEG